MKGAKRGIKALAILATLLASFVVPAWLMPKLEHVDALSNFHLDLIRSLLSALPTFLGLLVTYLYHNFDEVYIFVNRTWLWISNSTVSWSLSVEYREDLTPHAVERIFHALLHSYNEAEPLHNEPLEKLVNLPRGIGGVLKLKLTESAESDELEDSPTSLLVRVFDLNIPFRESVRAIDELDSLLENVVERELSSKDRKYTFRINFVDTNPYFGLFLQKQRVLTKDVTSFRCEFIDRNGQSEGRVDVGKKRLALVTNSAADFRRLSRRYVSLASPVW